MDYVQILYSFIKDQIKDTKYVYSKEMTVDTFKKMGEEHYSLKGYSYSDWHCAYTWAFADVFNGGCEVESI